jgi:hypothetical protein
MKKKTKLKAPSHPIGESYEPVVSWVLVEAPRWENASFFSGWLEKAETAARMRAANSPTRLEEHLGFEINFGREAMEFLRRLSQDRATILFDTASAEAEMFCLLETMGFFKLNENHYRMMVPKQLSSETLKRAFQRLEDTEDGGCMLHPEWLVRGMSRRKALRCQKRILDERYASGP